LQLLVFNEEFLVSAVHQIALITSLPFVDVAQDDFTDFAFVDAADEEMMFADQFAADAAIDGALQDQVVDVAQEEFQTDFAVADQAIADTFDDASFAINDFDEEFQNFDHENFQDQAFALGDAQGDEFVGDFNADQAVADSFNEEFAVDNFADQAVTDNFDNFDQVFLGADAAVQDASVNFDSSATSVFVSLAVVVASVVALLF